MAAVTQQPSIRSYRHRKAALRKRATGSGEPAAVLFAADNIAKVREYLEQLARSLRGGNPPRRRRLHHYTESLLSLEAVIPDHPLVRELRSELTELTPLPAPEGEAIAQTTVGERGIARIGPRVQDGESGGGLRGQKPTFALGGDGRPPK